MRIWQENVFLRGNIDNLGPRRGMALTYYSSLAKRIKTKSQKMLSSNSYVWRRY